VGKTRSFVGSNIEWVRMDQLTDLISGDGIFFTGTHYIRMPPAIVEALKKHLGVESLDKINWLTCLFLKNNRIFLTYQIIDGGCPTPEEDMVAVPTDEIKE
jgi:hypothetical protein